MGRSAVCCLAIALGVVQLGAAAEAGASEGSFSDAGGVHAWGIEQIAEWGIDSGCGNGRFCSSRPINRAEMATWLYRAAARLNGTPPPADAAPPVFDPDAAVTRGEAAAMLVAVFDHLAAVDEIQGVFADTGYTPAEGAIEGIHAAGLTRGCAISPLRYCPHQPITRAQAASMLARAIQRAEPTVGLIVNEPQAAQGYTLINSHRHNQVHLIDYLGRKVHTWELRKGLLNEYAKLLKNGNLLIFPKSSRSGPTWVAEVNQTGTIIWEYTDRNAHHDFLKLPSGNVLLLVRDEITKQEAVAIGVDPKYAHPDGLLYDYLIEVEPTGYNSSKVVWRWSMLDHLIQDHDPTKPNYGPIAGHPERIDVNYFPREQDRNSREGGGGGRYLGHLNAIDYNPALDQIMITSRVYSEFWIIDHNTTIEEAAGEKGDLLYRWGNPRTHGAGGYEDQQLFGPHNAHWIPLGLPGEGNVLIFNNGTEFTVQPRPYSTIEEVALPAFEDNIYLRDQTLAFAPPDLKWTYIAPNSTDFYAHYRGRVQRLPNGNTHIVNSPSSIIFQVTPDGKPAWKYINPTSMDLALAQGSHARLPTLKAPWYPPDYPGLKGLDLTPKGPLERYR